jgi:hypothetical protein
MLASARSSSSKNALRAVRAAAPPDWANDAVARQRLSRHGGSQRPTQRDTGRSWLAATAQGPVSGCHRPVLTSVTSQRQGRTQIARSGPTLTSTPEPQSPFITAARRAVIWPTYNFVCVLALWATTAPQRACPGYLCRPGVSRELTHLPLAGTRKWVRHRVGRRRALVGVEPWPSATVVDRRGVPWWGVGSSARLRC